MSVAAGVLLFSFVLGLIVLAGLGWRLFRQVTSLGRVVADAAERVAAASDRMPELPGPR